MNLIINLNKGDSNEHRISTEPDRSVFKCQVSSISQPAHNIGPPSARQRNAIQIAFRWRTDGGPLFYVYRDKDHKKDLYTKQQMDCRPVESDQATGIYCYKTRNSTSAFHFATLQFANPFVETVETLMKCCRLWHLHCL